MTKPAQNPSIRCFGDLVSLTKDGSSTLSQEIGLTARQIQHLKSIERKASESLSIIPDGIAAIGELLAHASEYVGQDTIHSIGWLIKELAQQIHTLDTYKEDAAYHLSQNEILQAKQAQGSVSA